MIKGNIGEKDKIGEQSEIYSKPGFVRQWANESHCSKGAALWVGLLLFFHREPIMVTRWSQKSPGLKILWLWTIGTAAGTSLFSIPAETPICYIDGEEFNSFWTLRRWSSSLKSVLVTNVFTTRIRDMDKILKEEDALRSKTDPAAASSQEHFIADE